MSEGNDKLPENLQAILSGNIEDATAKLGALEHDDLVALRDAEAKSEKRKGMLEAIDAESIQRATEADEAFAMAQEAAKKAGRELTPTLEVETLQAERDKLAEQLARAKASATKARQAAKPKASGKPRLLELGGKFDPDTLHTVAFTGRDGRTIPALPDLEFSGSDFTTRRDGMVELSEPIDFPESPDRHTVHAAWLLDDKGRPGMVCRFVAPVTVGGGSTTQLGAGYAAFRGPEKSRAEREAEAAKAKG